MRVRLTETAYTFNPSLRQISLQVVVKCGSPADINVYPGGALDSKDICHRRQKCRERSGEAVTYHTSKLFLLLGDGFQYHFMLPRLSFRNPIWAPPGKGRGRPSRDSSHIVEIR